MCVIVYKPAGEPLPSKDILLRCFTKNNDGAGMMFVKGDKVHIQKGYFTFERFYTDAKANCSKSTPAVFHFRISTAGGVHSELTHPFAVSENRRECIDSITTCDVGIAHNGVISIDHEYNDSDTLAFVYKYLSLIADKPDWYKSEDNVKLVSVLIGSYNKLAIMSSDGHVELIGDFIRDNGIYYSNTSYKEVSSPNNKTYWDLFRDEDGKYDFGYASCPVDMANDYSCCNNCRQRYHCPLVKGGK